MKRKRHSPVQIIRKLREADGMLSEGRTIAEVCRQLEVVEATFHRWRSQYGGMKADDAKQLKELQVENDRLKRLVAEQALDKQILEAERDRGGSVKGGENGEPGAPQGGGARGANDVGGVGAPGLPGDRTAAIDATVRGQGTERREAVGAADAGPGSRSSALRLSSSVGVAA